MTKQLKKTNASEQAYTPPEIMTTSDLAAYLKFHPETISRMTKQGLIPSTRLGRSIRYSRREVDRLFQRDAQRRLIKVESEVKQLTKSQSLCIDALQQIYERLS